jgi:hypothetical protein
MRHDIKTQSVSGKIHHGQINVKHYVDSAIFLREQLAGFSVCKPCKKEALHNQPVGGLAPAG